MDKEEKLKFLADSLMKAKQVMSKVEEGNINVTHKQIQQYPTEDVRQPQQQTMRNINNSKLPKEILESFRNNPIIDPTIPFGMESLMNEVTKQTAQPERSPVYNPGYIVESEKTAPAALPMDTKLLEYIVKKTVEEVLEQLSKNTTLDENIQIKIGDKTFGGKITKLKEVKKS